MDLHPHNLKVVILQPQIAPNTGNIARLCVATNTELHLVRPMGFVLSDRELKRSAMDYWPRLKLTVHDDTQCFLQFVGAQSRWLFTSKTAQSMWDVAFSNRDWLIFGSETSGIPRSIVDANSDRAIRIPQAPAERCLNLSTAVGIGLFEALRQVRKAQVQDGIGDLG